MPQEAELRRVEMIDVLERQEQASDGVCITGEEWEEQTRTKP